MAGSKYLIIKAKGGLGNRMLSAVTGLVYAQLSDRVPVIDWRDGIYADHGVNAYPLIFDSPVMPDPAEFDGALDVTPATWSGRLEKNPTSVFEADDPRLHTDPLAYRRYCVDLNRINQNERVAVFWSYLPKMSRLKKHLRHIPGLADKGQKELMRECLNQWFLPNARVRTVVNELVGNIAKPMIGVHVRYTDLKVPLQAIEKKLAMQLSRTPDATIFLATDSAEVENRFKSHFDNVHVTQKYLAPGGQQLHLSRTGSADKIVEAENALIDMVALSRCDHLVYSRRSTFSISSGLYGGLGPDQLHDIDHWNPLVVIKRLIQDYL